MNEYFHPTPEIIAAIGRIRKFCESPALNGGGMMLVTGLRGVGKTRLVDEALNDRREFLSLKEWSKRRKGNLDEQPGQESSAQTATAPEAGVPKEQRTPELEWNRQPFDQDPPRRGGFFHWLWSQLAGRIAWLSAIAIGRDPCRSRRRVKRSPRGVTRILLPVPVDPFFPDHGPTTDDKGQPVHFDLDTDTLALLRNLVFALTSAIDPRPGIRRHGRTLKARLGSLTYWFTRTALVRPQGHPGRLVLVLSLPCAFLAGLLLHFWLRDPTLAPLASWAAIPTNLPAVVLAFPIALAAAWLWLRHLDLARVRRISAHLYDLIHAQQYSIEYQNKLERTWRWEAKGRQLLRLLGVVALVGVGFLTHPEPLDWLKTRLQEWQGAPAVTVPTPGTSPSPQAPRDAADQKPATPKPPTNEEGSERSTPVESMTGLGAAALAVAGLLLVSYSGSRDSRRHASFGAGNRVWLIALLRRYLFLLHRAGIEPVLVIDEIDKLGAIDHETTGARPAATATAPRDDQEPSRPPADGGQLDRFIATLVRLKQSLGAEFIWILIDSDALYDRVIRDRSKPEQGPLATLIQCDVALNPVSFSNYYNYCQEFYRRKAIGARRGGGYCPAAPFRKNASPLPAPNPEVPDEAVLAAWWLESRGVFFGLSARTRESSHPSAAVRTTRDRFALFLARVLDYLRGDNWSEFTRCVCQDSREESPERTELAEKIACSPWHRRYLEIGLMDAAARLFDPTRRKPTYSECQPRDPAEPLPDPDTPRSLKRTGELGLIEFLQRLCQYGDAYPELKEQLKGIGITGGPIGIPRHAPQGNQDAQMRVQIPR